MRNVPAIQPRSRRTLAVAALLVGVALPCGRAAAQTFYGCSPGGNCATVRFMISPTPNEQGRYLAELYQTLRIDDFRTSPVYWGGARVAPGPGSLVRWPEYPDGVEFFGEWFPLGFGPGEPVTLQARDIAYFTGPATLGFAALVIAERPPELPVGEHPGYVGSIQLVPLEQIAPQTFLPEPSTLALVGSGALLTGLATWWRRRSTR